MGKVKESILLVFTLVIFICNSTAQEKKDLFPEYPPYVLEPAVMDYFDGEDLMQSRLFRTTRTRSQINLSGFWDFVIDSADIGESQKYYQNFPQPETRMWIPGTWNSSARYWQYQGAAWLQKKFSVSEDGILRIRFGGVFYLSSVWLDGILVGENEGAYSPFAVVVNNVKSGEHILTVRVDNRLNDETCPKDGADWFPFGGIYRPVYGEMVPQTYIDNFFIVPTKISHEKTTLNVKVFIKNLSNSSKKNILLYINGEEKYRTAHQIEESENIIEFNTILQSPKLWSPENSYLYSARLVLGNIEDDQYTRFGVRSLVADGYKILLNGQRFKMMGANHHDDHPDWGSALPPHIIRQDIEILKRMGANAVRGHYPPSEMFMDFCDQNGLFFMNEVPSWQYRPEQLAKKVVKEKIKKQYYDMIYRDMNHPSVFSWSLGNEWREFEKSYEDIKELVDYARTVDTTHFLTFITGGAHITQANELLDIICTNWSVYQWYWDPSFSDEDSENRVTSTVLSGEVAKVSIERLNNIHKNIPDKPVILTEFGGSGAQAGWHSWGNVKWSEEYQGRNVWDSGKYGLEQEWLSGGCVWQFCDTRTTHQRMLGPRLRGWNVKGVVDSYRSPKMSFYKLQELFHSYKQK